LTKVSGLKTLIRSINRTDKIIKTLIICEVDKKNHIPLVVSPRRYSIKNLPAGYISKYIYNNLFLNLSFIKR